MIVVDIETAPRSDTMDFCPPFDPTKVKLKDVKKPWEDSMAKTGTLKNRKVTDKFTEEDKQEAIRKKVAEDREKHVNEGNAILVSNQNAVEEAEADHKQKFMDGSTLLGEYCEIIAIGVMAPYMLESIVLEGSEKSILTKFWNLYDDDGPGLLGHYLFDFDLPVIIQRSRCHRLAIPSVLSTYDARRPPGMMIDTAKAWTHGVWKHYVKLGTLAKLFGVGDNKEGEVTGKDFYKYWFGSSEQHKLALEYVKGDVRETWLVAKEMRLI